MMLGQEPRTTLVGEWRFLLICIAVLLILTSMPYLFGYLISPSDQVFMGIVTFTPDIAQYLAWMRGFETTTLIDNHLTPEPTEAVYFNLLWWTLAKITAILSANKMLVVQLYRFFSIVTFSVALYWFIGLCLPDRRQRRGAFLVACFGGGLGWIWVVAKYTIARGELLFPRDVYVVEANTFMSAMGINHFTISAALMVLVYGLLLLGWERRQWRYALLAGLAAMVLGWEHAYDLLLVYTVIGSMALILLLRDGFSWHLLLYPLIVGLMSVWGAVYSVYITRAFPSWQAVLAQFDNAGAWTPDPIHLLVLLGLPFIMALLTFDGLLPLKERSSRVLWVRVWFMVNLVVIYFPVNFQVHYLNGIQIPIAILASAAFFEHILPWVGQRGFLTRLGRRWTVYGERMLLLCALLAVILVNVYILAWRFVFLARLPHGNYLERDEVAALDWLAARSGPEDVIFSGAELGQYVPGRTGARPFLAHWAMTIDLYDKQRMVRAFFAADTPDAERQAILRQFGVDYVLVGTEERALGSYDLAEAAYLEPCFVSPGAAVYCVQEAELTQAER